jgi:restriction endonuclease Mrr
VIKAGFGLYVFLIAVILLCLLWVAWFPWKEKWAQKHIRYTVNRLREAENHLQSVEVRVRPAKELARCTYQKWEEADKCYQRMAYVYELWQSYEEALQNYHRLLSVVQSQKYQLLHRNWRGMRGTDFEEFLREVFELQGYTVQLTKASGDYGIDLILTGKSRKIGVQAKGYSGNVGNHAVMEAHAGKDHYHCDSCVVITNSNFTKHAKRLAASVRCSLLTGADIPDLILGSITLESRLL